jgi:hypothetical protein
MFYSYEDFKQSGVTDFSALIIQDFWGAGLSFVTWTANSNHTWCCGGLFGFLFLKIFKSKKQMN